MPKEIYPELYQSFFYEMEQMTSLNLGAQKAFSEIQDALNLGKVSVCFRSKRGAYTFALKETSEKYDLFLSPDSFNQDVYQNYQFSMSDGIIVEILIYAEPSCDQWSARQISVLATLAEITYIFVSRLRLMEISTQSSMTDTLTGLPNSISFFRSGSLYAVSGSLSQYHAMYINIKNFRLINNRLNYTLGDQTLRKFGAYLAELIFPSEIVARTGGDNFTALIRNENVDEFIRKIRNIHITVVNQDAEEIHLELTTRISIYDIPSTQTDFGQVMQAIFNTLSIAKTVLHSDVVYYSAELEQQLLQERNIQQSFPAAIRKKEFVAYYQPKVSLEDYSLIGCEALVRWFKDGKMVMPGDFIPVFEGDNSICQLDFYMLDLVCQHIAEWLERGFNPPIVSINFSKNHLTNPNFVEDIMNTLKRHNIDPSFIEVELTETTNYQDFSQLKQILEKMRACGLTTSIDDFGTGYSSLNLLKDLPVDIIKVDRSFLKMVDGSFSRNEIVIRNIIQMATDLGIDLITEGVETPEQASLLRKMHCMMAQGFLFDKPLPKEEFEERMLLGQYSVPDAE